MLSHVWVYDTREIKVFLTRRGIREIRMNRFADIDLLLKTMHLTPPENHFHLLSSMVSSSHTGIEPSIMFSHLPEQETSTTRFCALVDGHEGQFQPKNRHVKPTPDRGPAATRRFRFPACNMPVLVKKISPPQSHQSPPSSSRAALCVSFLEVSSTPPPALLPTP
ncbi:hypothetical protein PDE_08914 [Penicillium oxalicum 114-2]|uniref:Uncharacterized protein n=1 Tax=Penicillium oxalicum (strain 114-2 / CGMCC 5302) TaxID=933388 RepID=S8BFS0_PENO1|nr:hypothetical protein PDE_08914 [Penicillium oxalicum 114-2]